MTDRQENKLSAYEAIEKILNKDTNRAIWTPVAQFGGLVTQFETSITDIHSLAAMQSNIITGIATFKANLRGNLINAMIKVINGVAAYAIFSDDTELLESVGYNYSDLRNSRDNALAETATTVYGIAYPIRSSLTGYLVTEADITLIETLKIQFLDNLAEPRAAKVEIKGVTHDLKLKFTEADALLRDKMDRTILIFKPSHPDFVENYIDARSIIDLGVRHTGKQSGRITGTVLQAGTLIPLQNASVEVVGTMRTTKTDVNGYFSLIFYTNATRIIRVTLENHGIYTSNSLQINPGDVINLNIQLQPNV
jgi:hypothetical protein